MIQLSPDTLIGTGLHRQCHRHPENSHRCIKVVVNGGSEETVREQAYYRHLINRNINWDMLPQFYGNTLTNMGEGAIFELVHDFDGNTSTPLEKIFQHEELTRQHASGIRSALPSLKRYLLKYRVITMTIHPKNILYKRIDADNAVFVIIDNIGNSDFIPTANHYRFFAEKKIQRKWQKFENSLLNMYADNKILCDIVIENMTD